VAVLRIRCLPASEALPKIVAGPAHIKMISMNGTRNEREGVMNGSRVEGSRQWIAWTERQWKNTN
jgi:hypothetical protein